MKKTLLLFMFLICMLLRAEETAEGARYGLLLWYTAVVPALFPFMVLSALLVAGNGLSVLMVPFHLLLHPLLGLSPEGCYVFLSGLVCGYPMGAKTCADFLTEGRITAKEARLLMVISNHPSPMFLLGYVYPFFKDQLPLPVLLSSVYSPVLILGAAARLGGGAWQKNRDGEDEQRNVMRNRKTVHRKETQELQPAPISLDEAILSAAELLCKIGGYLILFSILIVLLRRAAFLPVLPRLLLILSMEMTTGIREAAATLPFPYSAMAACGALAFGGFSGLFQTRAVIGHAKKAGLSIRPYFFWKLLHSVLSMGLCLGLFLLFLRNHSGG